MSHGPETARRISSLFMRLLSELALAKLGLTHRLEMPHRVSDTDDLGPLACG